MALSLTNAVRLGGSYEFSSQAIRSCSFMPLTNVFSDETKKSALETQIQSNGWKLNCNSSGTVFNHVENQGATKTIRWWEVTGTDNFREILSEEELKDSLKNAGNKLVVVYFYAPSCGGCRPLHPKMYQIAEAHQEVTFLKVNLDEHKSLCKELKIPVVPFYQLHRGTHGRIRSFSCTIATIHKLKDALKKHVNEEFSLPPAKVLEDGAMLKLASNKEINVINLNHSVGISANHELVTALTK
ncbi:Thioredoxin [Rhynchospora pubera]|uniref:Thioredoxin n=1 Tax=Rhynchospora pubera TaxID=906938 RepID=A0AAV8C7S8_9POAL|nr:Thioredoxin [Rhynchospora pubera]